MIKYDDLSTLVIEGNSGRKSKHHITPNGNKLIITSSNFKTEIELDLTKVTSALTTVEVARQLMRGVCKRQAVKYTSSYQNIADKLFSMIEAKRQDI